MASQHADVHGDPYLDFYLKVQPAAGDTFRVDAFIPTVPFPGTLEGVRLPKDFLALPSGGQFTLTASEAKKLGTDLFEALFSGAIRDSYLTTLQGGHRLRLVLDVPPGLASLPWEILYDDILLKDHLSLSPETSVVRFVPKLQENKPLSVTSPLRILAMVATPADRSSPEMIGERDQIITAFAKQKDPNLVELEWVEGQDKDALQEKILQPDRIDVFHFIGHGGVSKTAGAFIALAKQQSTDPLFADDLVHLLEEQPIRLVVLTACQSAHGEATNDFSNFALRLVQTNVPAVVAMRDVVTTEAAAAFAGEFYRELARGKSIEDAVREGRQAISPAFAGGSTEWATPVLYLRATDSQLLPQEPWRNRLRKYWAAVALLALLAFGGVWSCGQNDNCFLYPYFHGGQVGSSPRQLDHIWCITPTITEYKYFTLPAWKNDIILTNAYNNCPSLKTDQQCLLPGSGVPNTEASCSLAVTHVQECLIALGYSVPTDNGKPSGKLDETRDAIEKFQADHGLTVDAILGRNTLEKLQDSCMHLESARRRPPMLIP